MYFNRESLYIYIYIYCFLYLVLNIYVCVYCFSCRYLVRLGLRQLGLPVPNCRLLNRKPENAKKKRGQKGGESSRGDPPQKTVSDPLTSVRSPPPSPISLSLSLITSVRNNQNFPQVTPSETASRRVSENGFQGAILARLYGLVLRPCGDRRLRKSFVPSRKTQ